YRRDPAETQQCDGPGRRHELGFDRQVSEPGGEHQVGREFDPGRDHASRFMRARAPAVSASAVHARAIIHPAPALMWPVQISRNGPGASRTRDIASPALPSISTRTTRENRPYGSTEARMGPSSVTTNTMTAPIVVERRRVPMPTPNTAQSPRYAADPSTATSTPGASSRASNPCSA